MIILYQIIGKRRAIIEMLDELQVSMKVPVGVDEQRLLCEISPVINKCSDLIHAHRLDVMMQSAFSHITIYLAGKAGLIKLDYHRSQCVIYIRSISIYPASQGDHIARDIIYSLFDDPGIHEIQLLAVRSDYHNGYYYWARVGFDSRLPSGFIRSHQSEIPECYTVQDVVQTLDGLKWWREYGIPFYGVLKRSDLNVLV